MRRHPSAYSAVARKNASSQASQKRTWARCGRVVGALAIFNEKPDRKLETGHARQGQPPGTGHRRNGPAAVGTSPHAEVEGHASTGRAGASSGMTNPDYAE